MSKIDNEMSTVKISSSDCAEVDEIQQVEIDFINKRLDEIRKPKAYLFGLEELLNKLKAVNVIFAKQLTINEAKYSSLQKRLEKEVAQLTSIYEELKCSKVCIDLLTLQETCVQNDIKNMEEECQVLRNTEMQEFEDVVAKQEPQLFQTYKSLYRFPEKRKVILCGLETEISNKRKALDILASKIRSKRFLYNLSSQTFKEEKPERPRTLSLLPPLLSLSKPKCGRGNGPSFRPFFPSPYSHWNIL